MHAALVGEEEVLRGAHVGGAFELAVLDDFSPAEAKNNLRQLSNAAPVIQLSSKTQTNIRDWLNWLHREIQHFETVLANGERLIPNTQSDGQRLHSNP